MGEQGREELRRQDCVRRGGGEQACGRVRRAGARGRAVNAGEEGEGEEHPTTDWGGHANMAEVLLKKGADVEARTNKAVTTL